jgi:hypothetical protein
MKVSVCATSIYASRRDRHMFICCLRQLCEARPCAGNGVSGITSISGGGWVAVLVYMHEGPDGVRYDRYHELTTAVLGAFLRFLLPSR